MHLLGDTCPDCQKAPLFNGDEAWLVCPECGYEIDTLEQDDEPDPPETPHDKRVTVRLHSEQLECLKYLAKTRKTSVGQIVRDACWSEIAHWHFPLDN